MEAKMRMSWIQPSRTFYFSTGDNKSYLQLHNCYSRGPSEGGPGVQQGRPVGWAAVLTGQRPGLVVQGLGQVLNSEIMLVT